jgi:hypothetical protein
VIGSACAQWQWSIFLRPEETSTNRPMRAYLWVPPNCSHLRAVVIGNSNMLEQGILEDPEFRATLSELGMGEIFFSNIFDAWFDPATGSIPKFNRMMARLSQVSGYDELNTPPVIAIGHSACASYPWNFGANFPDRTLAMLSIHGDSPRTNLPGSGRPNFDWGDRNIDGIPGLLDMGEYEWWEARLDPTVAFRKTNPRAVISLRCDAGNGHFNTTRSLIDYLCMYIRDAAAARLPANGGPLVPVNPAGFWLEDRWEPNAPPKAPAAPYANYKGDRSSAYFCFGPQEATATEDLYASQRGKLPQLVGFKEGGEFVPQTKTHEQIHLIMVPEEDGVSFTLHPAFYSAVPDGNENPPKWAGLPVGSPLGHADGPIQVDPIYGPVEKIGPNRFRIKLNVTSLDISKGLDIWFAATQPGDSRYKSAVQQALMRVQPNSEGIPQVISFPDLPDVKAGTKTVSLRAASSASMPVSYYVLEGPAELEGNSLKLTKIPPRAAFPVKITVVAWQWGRAGAAAVQTATPVARTFMVTR